MILSTRLPSRRAGVVLVGLLAVLAGSVPSVPAVAPPATTADPATATEPGAHMAAVLALRPAPD